jgi:uncharacterized oligopeptide transporter (OPT) family protein
MSATPDARHPPPGVDPERWWLENVHQPGAKQLTVRAVLTGMVIGAVMCLSNLYVVLKTGWSMGVTITACILAWALFQALRGLRLVRDDFTTLENNAMSSVASAAGYMTGGGNMAAVPALLVLTGERLDPWAMFAWFACIALLGVFVAIPIKRQLINVEQLPFPTGTATAETLRALHAGKTGAEQARLLGIASAIGAVIAFFRDMKAPWMPFNTPEKLAIPGTLGGLPLAKWSVSIEGGLLMIGAGMLMSWRTGWSLLLGALANYLVLAPWMVREGVIADVSAKAIVQWSLWCGASILVSSGLLSFAFQWRMVAKSLGGLARLAMPKSAAQADDPLAGIEAPASWLLAAFAVVGPVVVWLMSTLFGIPIWAGVLALPLSLVMGTIAARVTGETDVTPTKALGPVTQLLYGGLLPNNLPANIMSANVTGGVGLHAADLLTDLKSGYLLGAHPRQQLYAQLFGVVAGAAIIVPAFNLLVPSAEVIGSEAFPAPAVQVWAGVSKVFSQGLVALHPTARVAAFVGLLLGVGLTLAERFAPKAARAFVPAPTGLGLAFVLPAYSSFGMFIGAGLAEAYRRKEGTARDPVTPVASGFIAGESLMGIVVAMSRVLGG